MSELSIGPPHALGLALCVDPDVQTRTVYAQCLRSSGFDTDEAADGREALAKALMQSPSVIIAETRLPGLSGYDLCALLRSDADRRDVPIVVVTAHILPVDLDRAVKAGADAVLTKPCPLATLLAAVDQVIATRARPRDSIDRTYGAIESPSTDRPPNGTVRRRRLSKTHRRGETTTPPRLPGALICPRCDRALTYDRSHLGGVTACNSEQWDYYHCGGGCGQYQFRQRTRTIRAVAAE